jgi:hypothetical protein
MTKLMLLAVVQVAAAATVVAKSAICNRQREAVSSISTKLVIGAIRVVVQVVVRKVIDDVAGGKVFCGPV